MKDSELNQIVRNEIEWRKQLWRKLENNEKELHDFKIEMAQVTTSLKVKIGMSGAFLVS
jgi:hypothetical protein